MKINSCLKILLAAQVYSAYAGSMGEVNSCSNLSCMPWFVEVGSGASWSNTINPQVDLTLFDPAVEGYNSDLGTAPLYMAGLGYSLNPFLNIDINYTFRGMYHYQKYQTALGGAQNPLPNKTRFFDISSNAVMVNGTLNGLSFINNLFKGMGASFIQPFIGGGIGVSYNTLSNFHTVISGTNWVGTVLQDKVRTSFAWQGNAGLEWKIQRFAFDLGYRYFNAGTLETNNALITSVNSQGTPITSVTITPITGTLSANEIFLTARVAI